MAASVVLVSHNVGSLYPSEILDQEAASSPGKPDIEKIRQVSKQYVELARAGAGRVSEGGKGGRMPDFVMFGNQEVGGTKKENCPLFMKEGGLIDDFYNNLEREMASAYKSQGRSLWCSGILLQPFVEGVDQDQFTGIGNYFCVDEGLLAKGQVKVWRVGAAGGGKEEEGEGGSWVDPREIFGGGKGGGGRMSGGKGVWRNDKLHESSRKGFTHTRWLINGRQIDLVAVHLLHDADNVAAAAPPPSPYAVERAAMLKSALDRCSIGAFEAAFVVGDFNFRLDLHDVLAGLPDTCKVIGPKDVECGLELGDCWDRLRVYDMELTRFNEAQGKEGCVQLFEIGCSATENGGGGGGSVPAPCRWPPTYPLSTEGGALSPRGGVTTQTKYSGKRMLAWCDRVVGTPKAWEMVGASGGDEAAKRMGAGEVSYACVSAPYCDHDAILLGFRV